MCKKCGFDLVESVNWLVCRSVKGDRQCNTCSTALRVAWHRANPTGTMLHSAKARARRLGVPFNITRADITIPPRCPILGLPLSHNRLTKGPQDASPSLDRLVPELGYTRGNVFVISNRANRIKNNATLPELEAVTSWLRRMLKPLH